MAREQHSQKAGIFSILNYTRLLQCRARNIKKGQKNSRPLPCRTHAGKGSCRKMESRAWNNLLLFPHVYPIPPRSAAVPLSFSGGVLTHLTHCTNPIDEAVQKWFLICRVSPSGSALDIHPPPRCPTASRQRSAPCRFPWRPRSPCSPPQSLPRRPRQTSPMSSTKSTYRYGEPDTKHTTTKDITPPVNATIEHRDHQSYTYDVHDKNRHNRNIPTSSSIHVFRRSPISILVSPKVPLHQTDSRASTNGVDTNEAIWSVRYRGGVADMWMAFRRQWDMGSSRREDGRDGGKEKREGKRGRAQDSTPSFSPNK